MITIRPVSDLRNKFTEIEDCVKSGKAPDRVRPSELGCVIDILNSL